MLIGLPAEPGFASKRRTFLAGLASLPAVLSDPAHAQDSKDKVSVTIPIALNDDRLWTTIQFGDGEELIGLFDSGSHIDVVAAAVARQMRMREVTAGKLGGIGGTEASVLMQARDPLVGRIWRPEHLWAQSSTLLDATPYKYLFGVHTMGSNNSELDLASMHWRIHKSSAALLQDAAKSDSAGVYQSVEDSYFWNGWINEVQLPCVVGGIDGRMLVDTGSPTNFVINSKMTQRMGLWDSGQPYAPWRLRGFGRQRALTRLYRIDQAQFPTCVMPRPLVMLTNPAQPNQELQRYDGLIGMRALQGCSMLFDKDNRKLWLRPKGGTGLPDLRYPYSGLWLGDSRKRITIEEVGIGSPAAEAGLQASDVIVNAELDAVKQAINGPAGSMVDLEIERGSKRWSVSLKLRPYL